MVVINKKNYSVDKANKIDSAKEQIFDLYKSTRKLTVDICNPLEIEDYVVQPMDDVSPPKWHLGHTSWFFETFVLKHFGRGYKALNDTYNFIFNSYYESIGERIYRPKRGSLSRPTVKEVIQYRNYVDEKICDLIQSVDGFEWEKIGKLIEFGIHHEMQHQELLLTDIKNIFGINPLRPTYIKANCSVEQKTDAIKSEFIEIKGGLREIGFDGNDFSFDNEKPIHKVFIDDFKIQNRLVTNKEYLEFINDGGYSNPVYWLSDAWAVIQKEKWNSPLYWEKIDNEWLIMTLSGLLKLNLSEPVCHVSFYEADAYARWKKKRLLTEAEWEVAASTISDDNNCNFLESRNFHPIIGKNNKNVKIMQMLGDAWEWTGSSYLSYPGYVQPEGAFGEYNGKFMCNQIVLRGGSCVTPSKHIRKTYRNFFQPDKRWQFTGIRLASEV